MKKLIIGLMVVGLMGMMAGTAMAATDSANINLLVTPVVATSLIVSPTWYDFGNVAVKTSTGSATAITITNDGSVAITVDKAVWTDGDWDITKSSSVQDGFFLWAMTNASVPSHTAFETALSSFTKTLQGHNTLRDSSAAGVTMNPSGTESLWFRLDMPASVSNTNEQTIHVRLRGTSQ